MFFCFFSVLHFFPQLRSTDGKFFYPDTGRVSHRIGQCGWSRNNGRFPHSTNPKWSFGRSNFNQDRLDGWRLFQSRFSEGDREQTFLQVNRDPGLVLIYPACVVLLLGLVIVFAQKRHFLKALARHMNRHNTSAGARFAASVATVILAFIATLPGVMMIAMIPEGPILLLGIPVTILGLALESIWVNTWLRRRLDGPTATTEIAT